MPWRANDSSLIDARLAEAIPAHLRAKTLIALETMPACNRLCHGDFHPDNILMTGQGEIATDWIDASRGHLLADLARATVPAFGAAETRQLQGLLSKTLACIFPAAYIRYYFKLSPGGLDTSNFWLSIVVAANLSEKIP